MDRIVILLASPAATAGILAAAWAPAAGGPSWPALARGRFAGALLPSLAVGLFVFAFVQRLTALAQP
jgi:hypothetical protein